MMKKAFLAGSKFFAVPVHLPRPACAQSINRPSDEAMSGTREINDRCSVQQFGEGIARAEAVFSAGWMRLPLWAMESG